MQCFFGSSAIAILRSNTSCVYPHRHCHGDETMFGYPFGFRVDKLLAPPYRNLGSCHGTTGA